MKKKKEKIEIGQKVFIITRECKIEEKEVLAVINTGDEIGYTLDKNSCGGYTEYNVFTTKAKAQVQLQNFMDELKFKVGDLIVFEYKEYSNKKKTIGRIVAIIYSGTPYEIRGSYKEFDTIAEEQILLKVKNEFIENYGNLQEFYEEFKEKEKEISDILQMIHREHDRLEKELETSIRKQYSVFSWNKSKPKFQDRFCYEEEDNY
jgi:hypothetical protein